MPVGLGFLDKAHRKQYLRGAGREYVRRGRLDLWVGEEHYRLKTGAALTFESRIPHKNRNPGPGTTQVLWVMTPPSC